MKESEAGKKKKSKKIESRRGSIRITPKEKGIVFLGFIVGSMIISYAFYGNFVALLGLAWLYFPVRKVIYEEMLIRKKKKVLYEFKDALTIIRNCISAGFSIENAVGEGTRQMENMYGKKSIIAKELVRVINRLKVNISVEQAFKEMAVRVGIEEIRLYANLLSVTKRGGGEIREITDDICGLIERKIEVENEVDVAIASEKYEQTIISFMPVIIILYVKITNDGFMDVMYETFAGRIIMSTALLIYGISVYWSLKIIRLDI